MRRGEPASADKASGALAPARGVAPAADVACAREGAAAGASGATDKVRVLRLPLFWRLFGIQVAVLALVFLLLVFAPVTVSIPVAVTELAVLAGGLAGMVGLTFVLLRSALRPLTKVTSTMRRIDPLRPGARVPVVGEPDVAALAQAFNDMLDRLEHERRESARRALTVQEEERRHVARELHDEVGQIFTAIMLQLETLAAHVPSELNDDIALLRETARSGATDVRRIAARLRPQVLDDLGLQSALTELASSFAEQTGLEVERRIDPLQLDRERELVVYRVAQEALTNVARHAEARRVELSLRRDGDAAVLRVRDDGRGLPPGALSASSGIPGMRERAMLIGAELRLSDADRGGVELRLRVPLGGGGVGGAANGTQRAPRPQGGASGAGGAGEGTAR